VTLFKRSVVAEIASHSGVVFSTLIVVWLSVLLVRLLGQASSGTIGADVVFSLAAFSSITALPVILAVALFIAVLATVTRNYRESEMVVWFASGLSLRDWIRPVLSVALPVAGLVALLTMLVSPWAYRQIEEYRQRFEQRSDISRVAAGQFVETEDGARVFFAQEPDGQGEQLGRVMVWVRQADWLSVVTAENAHIETESNGDRFLVLASGHRYDLRPGTPEFRMVDFDAYGVRLENRNQDFTPQGLRERAENVIKARPTVQLLQDGNDDARAQLMWRVALPLAAVNLALLAIPLGAVNPRLGKSGDFLIAGLVGLLYMNLINLSRGWIRADRLDFWVGVWLVHALFAGLMAYLLWRRLRVRVPRQTP